MTASSGDDWDHPETMRAWLAFDAASDRYRSVNQALASHAALADLDAPRILDVGAGTGGTTGALLPLLPPSAEVVCVEPAAAMREASPVRDPRVRWVADLPDDRYDRVVCGASVWLLGPLAEVIPRLRARLAPDGALLFAIPAGYLGEPDPPGGGADPWLRAPVQRLIAGRTAAPEATAPFPDRAGLEQLLVAANLRGEPWQVTTHWTLASYAAWLALPPISAVMNPELSREERRARLDAAVLDGDSESWRDETWLGWTAWA
ncbi:MAG: hypothetical protein KDA24_26560 [Deltaproteobacteria bacterium]|nr:hypothetical protein [Deltaproteobacteria bacterium]